MLSESTSVTEAIKMAIDLEKRGKQFYSRAAENTRTESGKRVFELLAREEVMHLKTFTEMLDSIGNISNWREVTRKYPQNRKVPVFDQGKSAEKAEEAKTDELEALRFAMQQEKEAITFFEKMQTIACDEDCKRIIEFVKEQEKYHYDLLQAEYDSITQTGFWFDSAEFRMDGKF